MVYANQNEVKNCYNAGICTSGYVVKYNHYTASHMYRCFSEKKFARYMSQVNTENSMDKESLIGEDGYMKSDEFFEKLNQDGVWIRDINNINDGYPVFK